MWLIRFQNIETRDYHRVERFCHQVDFVPKKFSAMLLTKGVLLHVFQKKSWRQIGKELNVPHLSVYNFYSHIQDSAELQDFLLYFIERRIVLSIADERNITREYLETDEIVEKSLEKFRIML